MKLRSIAMVGVAALALCVPASANSFTGWYTNLNIGWDSMGSIKATFSPGPVVDTFKTKDTALFLGAFGYKFDNGFRLEDELGYTSHGMDSSSYSGHASVTSDIVDVLYDFPLSQQLDLEVGGGIGAADANLDVYNSSYTYIKGSHTDFIWQGIVGLNYAITEHTELSLSYHYRSISSAGDYNTSYTYYTVKGGDITENAVMFGIKFFCCYAIPVPVAVEQHAPPPPPPPPCPVKTYIVFFDFDKSNLTEKAQEVVAEAVKATKVEACGLVKVMVTGHTDTVGSDKYNMKLSVRRAEAVKDEMVREGMDGAAIAIDGKGFHDPLVPTGPGVREPQNRRAVIDLSS